MAAPKHRLLNEFLGEVITVFMVDMEQQLQTEEGAITMPLAVQGLLKDVDEEFVLLSDDLDMSYNLVRIDLIGRIESGNSVDMDMMGDKRDLN